MVYLVVFNWWLAKCYLSECDYKYIILFLESLLRYITCWIGILNHFEVVVFWQDARKLFIFYLIKQTDIIIKRNKMSRHIFTVVSYVYSTQKIGEWPIIRSNKLKNTLLIKYNGKMYYREVPEITNCSWKYELLKIQPPLEKFLQKQAFLMHFVVRTSLQIKEVLKWNLSTPLSLFHS